MRKQRWVIQQQIPEENSMMEGDERWITVLDCSSEESAREHLDIARQIKGNWPTRILKITEELVTV